MCALLRVTLKTCILRLDIVNPLRHSVAEVLQRRWLVSCWWGQGSKCSQVWEEIEMWLPATLLRTLLKLHLCLLCTNCCQYCAL
jgi:hypothetical protein